MFLSAKKVTIVDGKEELKSLLLRTTIMRTDLQTLLANLPAAENEVLPGLKWGECDKLFTPLYWKLQYHLYEKEFSSTFYKTGDHILEEICACLLGGYGIKAELAYSAFQRLKSKQLLRPGVAFEQIVEQLMAPLCMDGKNIRYRFPKQKSLFLYQFLNRADLETIPMHDVLQFKQWLLSIPGIGNKTAAWIIRNWFNSDDVAIIDIHIYRAGLITGFFHPHYTLTRDYSYLEQCFLKFARAIDVKAAALDLLIWNQMKTINGIAIKILKQKILNLCQEEEAVVGVPAVEAMCL
jgi:N-glycosylase/DNA lyase